MAIDWNCIEHFVGFGNPSAIVAFVGMEEGLQRDTELDADLELRSTYEPYMDLVAAQGDLGVGTFFGPNAVTQRTWRPMCHLMLRRQGVAAPTNVRRRRYQADELGRADGQSLLTELLPYPHSDARQWLYSRFGRFHCRSDYEADLITRRQELLRNALAKGNAELVVCYGKHHWRHFKGIFPTLAWSEDGPFEYGRTGNAKILLAPLFSSRAYNSGGQLQRFADLCEAI
jgi:hypothetical protein